VVELSPNTSNALIDLPDKSRISKTEFLFSDRVTVSSLLNGFGNTLKLLLDASSMPVIILFTTKK
jgi:hypothetical protein